VLKSKGEVLGGAEHKHLQNKRMREKSGQISTALTLWGGGNAPTTPFETQRSINFQGNQAGKENAWG
jgi:hypothetical protein